MSLAIEGSGPSQSSAGRTQPASTDRSEQLELRELQRWDAAFKCFKENLSLFSTTYLPDIQEISKLSHPSCSFIQFLSRCLKLSRASSHPERWIGKPQDRVVSEEDPRNETGDLVRIELTRCSVSALSHILISANSLQDYYSYFVLILVKDVIKELLKMDTPLFPDRRQFLIGTASNLLLFKDHLMYEPSAVKLFDLARQLSDSISIAFDTSTAEALTLLIEVFEFLRTATNSYCSSDTKPQEEGQCVFIAKHVKSSTSHLCDVFGTLVNILNESMKILLFLDSKDNSDIETEVYTLISSIDALFFRISGIRSVRKLLLDLSENDTSLLRTLLRITETSLRLEAVLVRDNKSNSKLVRGACLSIYQTMITCGLEPAHNFYWFAKDALCCDASLLIDLISSSETVALEYIIRIIKHIKRNPEALLILDRSCILDESRQIDPSRSLFATELIEFLESFLTHLKRMHQKKLLPFNPSVLCDSMAEVICIYRSRTIA